MAQTTNARKGILIPEVLYPVLKVALVAFIIIILIAFYVTHYVIPGQNQIVDIIAGVFKKIP